ncbi:Dimethyladenosine transferase 1, mitochondrial [Kappamyces sp. JEL0680]|nr:Dimethyladenosine transferase 1, mitochondrial [Kappamyces sp. JEL0680]
MAKLPSTSQLLSLHRISPKKKFSQNFLDAEFSRLFVQDVLHSRCDFVVEIGAGPGSLTRQLLQSCNAKVLAVELDERFAPILGQIKDSALARSRFDYLLGDAMNQPLLVDKIVQMINHPRPPSDAAAGVQQDPSRAVATGVSTLGSDSALHIMGNLPFEIAGRLLAQWNRDSLLKKNLFALAPTVEMTLLLGKQMGERLLPTFSKRNRSVTAADVDRFSTITQTAFDVSLARVYPKKAFAPSPSSDCIALRFANRKQTLFQDDAELDHFLALLKQIYILPNKQIGNACSAIPNAKELLARVDIDTTERIFAVSIAKLIRFASLVRSQTM